MSKAKYQMFEDLAGELALLSDADRKEFADFLVRNYQYTASELCRDISFAEMDYEFGPYDSEESYMQSRDALLL